MIQRIQSIYLLVAGFLLLAMYEVPVAVFESNNTIFNLFACHILNPETGKSVVNMIPMAVLPILSLFLSLFAMLKYKNRSFQLKLGKLNMLMLLALIAVEVIYFFRINGILANGRFGFSAIIPVVSLLLIFMAHKAIKKDDDLVRSADRIR